MKVTLLKIAKNKEVINRLDLQALADLIRKNPDVICRVSALPSKGINIRIACGRWPITDWW